MRILGTLIGGLALSGCAVLDNINATRAYNYVGIPHFAEGGKGTSFDDNIPGVAFGSEAPTSQPKYAVGIEAGLYRDPNRDRSVYGLTYMERDLFARDAPRRVRVGAFVGMSEYEDIGEELFDGVNLIGGLQMTVSTFGPHELRLRAMPGVGDSDYTFFLGSNFKF